MDYKASDPLAGMRARSGSAVGGTIGGLLRSIAAQHPDRPFVKVDRSDWLSYGTLDDVSDRVAGGLARLGCEKGDRVAVILPNRLEAVELLFASAKAGTVEVPINIWLKGEFLRYQLAFCGAKILIADADGYRTAAPLLGSTDIETVVLVGDGIDSDEVHGLRTIRYEDLAASPPFDSTHLDLSERDVASILFTSGTTGDPKGCIVSHGFYLAYPEPFGRFEWVLPGDRAFNAFPLFHMGGHHLGIMTPLVLGASVCVAREFSASSFMSRATEEGATLLLGIGVMASAILTQPPDPEDEKRKFRLAAWVPLDYERQLEFERRFTTPVVGGNYGQTESGAVAMVHPAMPKKRVSCGIPNPNFHVAIVDESDNEVDPGTAGEIVVRPKYPDTCFQGYWNNPAATIAAAANFWHHTGDVGRMDADGHLVFVDRKKDSLRRRGESVSSQELEAAISQHASILEVAVCGVPSSLGEQDIRAVIVCHPSEQVSPRDLFEFFRSTLPYYAIPRYVDIRSGLPRGALGKVLKQALRDEGVTDTTWDLTGMGFVVAKSERRTASPGTSRA